jgi:flavodoxin I
VKALVVYDSFFGNTEKVAQAIGAALSAQAEVQVVRVNQLAQEQLSGLDILVVGSPTRAFSASPDTKKFLARIPTGTLKGVRSAGFDTRIALEDTNSRVLPFFVKLFGYAAEPIARQLVKKGARQVVAPQGFIVMGTEGPMKDGELERAAEWAQKMLVAG